MLPGALRTALRLETLGAGTEAHNESQAVAVRVGLVGDWWPALLLHEGARGIYCAATARGGRTMLIIL